MRAVAKLDGTSVKDGPHALELLEEQRLAFYDSRRAGPQRGGVVLVKHRYQTAPSKQAQLHVLQLATRPHLVNNSNKGMYMKGRVLLVM